MLVTTKDSFPDRKIEKFLGVVQGSVVKPMNSGDALAKGREEALAVMEKEAVALGADGVIQVKSTESTSSSSAHFLVHGNAVKLK